VYYTDRAGNAALDGKGDLIITPREEKAVGYGLVRVLPIHLGAAEHQP
jgi:hypothetical protein